jgi:GH15 family glucan-1,4-alpha-glucosidase
VARHALSDGRLPEQVSDHLLSPDLEPVWIERWGPVAAPLLWSHAMFLTLAIELGVVEPATPIEDRLGPPRVRTS